MNLYLWEYPENASVLSCSLDATVLIAAPSLTRARALYRQDIERLRDGSAPYKPEAWRFRRVLEGSDVFTTEPDKTWQIYGDVPESVDVFNHGCC